MAQSHEPLTPDDLEAARRRRDEQRRRLDRIAQRYAQLEEALENLESLVDAYRVTDEPQSPPERSSRPRKPR